MIDKTSEKWRHECEARYLAGLKRSAATEYIEGVENKRGKAAADKLLEDARKILNERRSENSKR